MDTRGREGQTGVLLREWIEPPLGGQGPDHNTKWSQKRDGWLTTTLLFPFPKHSWNPSSLHIHCHVFQATWAIGTISWLVFLLSFLPTSNPFSLAAQGIYLKLEHEPSCLKFSEDLEENLLLQPWLGWTVLASLSLCLVLFSLSPFLSLSLSSPSNLTGLPSVPWSH